MYTCVDAQFFCSLLNPANGKFNNKKKIKTRENVSIASLKAYGKGL